MLRSRVLNDVCAALGPCPVPAWVWRDVRSFWFSFGKRPHRLTWAGHVPLQVAFDVNTVVTLDATWPSTSAQWCRCLAVAGVSRLSLRQVSDGPHTGGTNADIQLI